NNYFDSAGQLRASEDAAGGRRYFFYDQNGRVAAEVDATGAVTEYRRDAMGRVVETLRHAERAATSGWLVGGQVTVGGVDAIRPGWHGGCDGLPIQELKTDGLDGTYSPTLRLEDGRLVVQRGNHSTPVWPLITSAQTTSLAEGAYYTAEITTTNASSNY